jgi:hypothetical protein
LLIRQSGRHPVSIPFDERSPDIIEACRQLLVESGDQVTVLVQGRGDGCVPQPLRDAFG